MCWINWVEENKDLFLALGALLSPFAAVFVGLKAAKHQARAAIESSKLQVQAAALRDTRQRTLEKLRDEFASQIYAIMELKDAIDVSRPDAQGHHSKLAAIEARKIRISITVSSASEYAYKEWSKYEDAVYRRIAAQLDGKLDSSETDTLEDKINNLVVLARSILEGEERRATGSD